MGWQPCLLLQILPQLHPHLPLPLPLHLSIVLQVFCASHVTQLIKHRGAFLVEVCGCISEVNIVYCVTNMNAPTVTMFSNVLRTCGITGLAQGKAAWDHRSKSATCTSGHALGISQPDIQDIVAKENNDSEAAAVIEGSPSGDESAHSNESSWSMDDSLFMKVETIFISSAILAAKSPFFYKLFSNGMRESDQRHATLRICTSEEAAVIELPSFMYGGKLSTTSAALLLDVVMAADKLEVASCMRHCSQLLRSLPMTTESALLYLELPSSVSMAAAVQPLTDAAKEFLANKFRDINKFPDELMSFPLAGIEAILCSDDLQVASEDTVYDFVLKWTRAQYPKLEERCEILGSRLGCLIRFPYMTCRKVLTCNDMDHDLASKVVLEALFFNSEAPHRQRALTSVESTNRRMIERAYKYRPVKVVEFDRPHQQCTVYSDLKREECTSLFSAGRVYSQAFHLGGQGFILSAHCNMDQGSSFHCFGLFLGTQEKGSITFMVDYKFAARTKQAGEFLSKYKGYYTFTGGKAVGYQNLFGIPWTSFMAEDSPYFINGVLHLKAELMIKPPLLPPQ